MQVLNEQRKTFPLRLSRTIRAQTEELADREGISINQFILQALAEKVTRLEYFHSSGHGLPNKESRSPE